MNEESLEQLQTKIAFLERANTDLSDVVYRQQQELRALERRVSQLSERLQSLQADDRALSADEERPPHY